MKRALLFLVVLAVAATVGCGASNSGQNNSQNSPGNLFVTGEDAPLTSVVGFQLTLNSVVLNGRSNTPHGLLEISAVDARARGIAEGATVRVFNRRGEVLLKARIGGTVRPGVVSARLNSARMAPGFQSINALTSEKLTDMGNSATFYSVLVKVELSTASG
jgi:hypothetical protein